MDREVREFYKYFDHIIMNLLWNDRLSTLVLMRYFSMEKNHDVVSYKSDHIQADEEDDDEDESAIHSVLMDDQFLKTRHNAYYSCVRIVLNNILAMSCDDFSQNQSWIVPLLCKLIVCESLELRSTLSSIFEKQIGRMFR